MAVTSCFNVQNRCFYLTIFGPLLGSVYCFGCRSASGSRVLVVLFFCVCTFSNLFVLKFAELSDKKIPTTFFFFLFH